MNRFIQATQLNPRDELVWYTKHQGRELKCLWRRNPNLEGDVKTVDITFVAQWIDTDKVYVAFTRPDIKMKETKK